MSNRVSVNPGCMKRERAWRKEIVLVASFWKLLEALVVTSHSAEV